MSEGDSKFGFKDMEKALETLQLLESHDMQYRKLTVRGLLGRAKRVLSITKAADKLKNINEAIGVFEKWLAEHSTDAASQKNAKTDSEDKVATVPGLGFKDKAAAEATLRILAERDPSYQKLAIKGLIGSSKRVLAGTKNPDNIKAIKEGVAVLEDFLERFDAEQREKDNRAYLSLSLIEKLAAPEQPLAVEFLATYGSDKVKGNYKHLRTLHPKDDDSASWDIVRNRQLAKLLTQIKSEDAPLFEAGKPTALHLQLAHWAYSPQPEKLRDFADKQKAVKRRSSSTGSSDSSSAAEEDEKQAVPKKKLKQN